MTILTMLLIISIIVFLLTTKAGSIETCKVCKSSQTYEVINKKLQTIDKLCINCNVLISSKSIKD
jgi:hypothetical protein